MRNRKILLAKRPVGMPDVSHFETIETEVPEIKDGEMIVQTLYLSVDPYMRGRMSDEKSYAPPYPVGEPFVGGVVGKVIRSHHPDFAVGSYVQGRMEFAEYNVSDGNQLRKLDPAEAPVSTALHVLGMPGFTAYIGLLDIGQPKEGETVVVSGAAGAVGTIVGQIAKLKGCRVVGIAGSDDKCAFLTNELGFDAAINYKTVPDLSEALASACPDGVDVYFDNVGGTISDHVMSHINAFARIVICGQIALYNLKEQELGPRMGMKLLRTRSMVRGFIVSDHAHRYDEAQAQLTAWFQEGILKHKEHIVEGFDNTIEAFLGLFRGDNLGKQLIRVSE